MPKCSHLAFTIFRGGADASVFYRLLNNILGSHLQRFPDDWLRERLDKAKPLCSWTRWMRCPMKTANRLLS